MSGQMLKKTSETAVVVPMSQLLAPLYHHWEADTTEIIVIAPMQAIRFGQCRCDTISIPEYTVPTLEKLLRISAIENQLPLLGIDNPSLEGTCPNGDRITATIPPQSDNITISVRGHQKLADLSHQDYVAQGFYQKVNAFYKTKPFTPKQTFSEKTGDLNHIARLLHEGHAETAMALAINTHQNIIISGVTGCGKSTYLNTLLKLIPKTERIVTVEVGSRELRITQPNKTQLHCDKNAAKSMNDTTTEGLIALALRLRPKWLVMGEARSSEIISFLKTIKTGHPSLMTVHAGSIAQAKSHIVLMVKENPDNQHDRGDILQWLADDVDVWVSIGVGDTGLPYAAEIEVNVR